MPNIHADRGDSTRSQPMAEHTADSDVGNMKDVGPIEAENRGAAPAGRATKYRKKYLPAFYLTIGLIATGCKTTGIGDYPEEGKVQTRLQPNLDGTYTPTMGGAGPGGGIVYYAADLPFPCGDNLQKLCTHLEYAPDGWSGAEEDPTISWSSEPHLKNHTQGTSQNLGAGRHNTTIIMKTENDPTRAAAVAAGKYRGGGYDDWGLPSSRELNELCRYANNQTGGDERFCEPNETLMEGFSSDFYWGSYQPEPGMAWYQNFNSGGQSSVHVRNQLRVRPVRAFNSGTSGEYVPFGSKEGEEETNQG